MEDLLRSMWRWTRAGGRLGVTVLGTRFFDPMRDVFVDAVHDVRPDVEVVQPWKRTEDPDVLRTLLANAGVATSIETEDERLPLSGPDDWWRIAMGTGLRRTIMALGDAEAGAVRERCAHPLFGPA